MWYNCGEMMQQGFFIKETRERKKLGGRFFNVVSTYVNVTWKKFRKRNDGNSKSLGILKNRISHRKRVQYSPLHFAPTPIEMTLRINISEENVLCLSLLTTYSPNLFRFNQGNSLRAKYLYK